MELHDLWTWRINDGSTIFISALAVASIMALWLLNRASNRTSLPPGPRGLPIVGYLPFLSTHLHKSFTELAETYGPIYKLWLGSKMYVVIGSPSLAKQVLDHDVTFSARDPPIAAKIAVYGGNDIAFTSYGPEWKKLRKIFVREVLSIVRLDGSCEVRKQEVERAVKDVYGRRSDKGLDFGKLVFMTVSNTVMRMLFRGEESEMFFAKIKKLSDELTVLVAALNVSDLVPVLARFDLQGIEKRSRKLRWEFDRVLDSVIGERRKVVEDSGGEFKDGKDYLQILLDLNSHGDPASSITDSQLKGLLLDTIVGATDTTATTIQWTMAMLMKHPEAMQKVSKELDEAVGRTNLVDELHVPQLHYLDAVIKETFRLHPVLPILLPRHPSQDCKIGGYTIPKGARVFINAYAIHRDPQLWTNPLEFRPERFLEEDGSKFDYLGKGDYQFFPFGTGRRICAGIPLAEKMLKYVLASMLHSFEWRLAAEGMEVDLTDEFGVLMKLAKPLILVPTPKLDNPDLY